MEECAAYNFNFMSRKRTKIMDRKDVTTRQVKNSNSHNCEQILVQELGLGLRPRQFLTRCVWKNRQTRLMIANESIKSSGLFEAAAKNNNSNVIAFTSALGSYTASDNNTKTKFKYVCQVDLGGFIPRQVIDLGAVDILSDYIAMRELFSKDYEIDSERRSLLVGKLNSTHEHSKVESDEIERGKLLIKRFRNSEHSKVTAKTDNELVSAVAVEFGGKAWCRLSTTVRCGGKEALAFLLSVDSRSLMSEHDLKLSEVVTDERRLADNDREENDKGHTQVVSMLESNMLSDGTKVYNSMNRRMTWKENDGNLTLYSSPTTVLEVKTRSRSVKTMFGLRSKEIPIVQDKSVAATKITQVSETECKVSERALC